MPANDKYEILIKESPHKGESKELLTSLNSLTNEVKKLRSSLKDGTKSKGADLTKEVSKKFDLFVNKLEKLDSTLKKVDRLLKSDDTPKALKELAKEMSYAAKEIISSAKTLASRKSPKAEVQGNVRLDRSASKSINDLSINLQKLTKKIESITPSKKVALVDLETGPRGAGKKLGGQVDFVTQIGVLTTTLKDVLEKSGKELREASKSVKINVKPPKGMTEKEYNALYKNIKKQNKSFEQIPWKEITSEGLDLKKALEKAAKTIGDAELIIGHNIKDFDLKILNDAIKESGAVVKLAAKEYYDTLEASRKQFPKRGSHALENYRSQFEKEGKQYSAKMHTALADVEVVADVIKKLSSVVDTLSTSFASLDKSILANDRRLSSLTNVLDGVDRDYGGIRGSLKDLSNTQQNVSKTLQDIVVKDVKKMRSAIQASVVESRVIEPGKEYKYKADKGVGESRSGLYKKEAHDISELSNSLGKLQDNIVKSLEKGLRGGLVVVKNEFNKAFKLGKGKREWELKILDVNKIKRELETQFGKVVSPDWGSETLIAAYKDAFIKKESELRKSADSMAASIFDWLKQVGPEEMEGRSPYVKELHTRVKTGKVGFTSGAKELSARPDIQSIYETTVLMSEAIKKLRDPTSRLLKTLTVPAARVGEEGIPAFQTKYGSERSLAKFATLTTGLERFVKEFKSLGATNVEYAKYAREVDKAPFKPTAEERSNVAQLASELISRIERLGGRELAEGGYRKAITLRKLETGGLAQGEMEKINKSVQAWEETIIGTTGVSLDKLREEAHKLGIDALDVANALNKIDFENFYDILDKLYNVGEFPFMQKQSKMIMEFPRNVRQISEVKDALLGVMPLVEPGRPKRKPYDEEVVKILSKASGSMFPEEQKKRVVDIANVWEEISDTSRKLYPKQSEKQIPITRPIDLSDSASSQIDQFNLNFSSALKGLNKTMTSASTAGIRGLAPFEQFSAIQRQMSYAANALAGALPKAGGLEVPSIVSKREKALIEKGKYGSEGYGLNVITELRDTASTFEDQIVIAGKLAAMITKISKPLVGPAAELAERTTAIEPGVQKLTERGSEFLSKQLGEEFEDVVNKVAKQYQEVLGIPKTYRSGADVAEIGKEIVNVMREHRGLIIDVQMAKISEIFLNYFGRKFSTRFGTKGVSITPEHPPTQIKEYKDIVKGIAAGLEAKVMPGAGLGYAKFQKSGGQMLSEILEDVQHVHGLFDEKSLKGLTDQLRESGNKFIIDLFKDASLGLVTEEEAVRQRNLFEKVSREFDKLDKMGIGEKLKTGVSGLEQVAEEYVEQFGERRKPFELRPIEARISARGVAKRGLMPEVLEGMVNNLIGSTEDTTVILDNALTASKELRTKVNEYLEALGYTRLSKKEMAGVEKRLKAEGAEPEQIEKLKKWESQWSVYTDVIDEFGKTMQSFTAPKFLQVVEEPHIYKDWSQKEIEKGLKGARLNFQAFSAYAGIFGEGSSMMKELSGSTALAAREGWELIEALRMLDPSFKESREQLLKGLQEVDVSDLKSFEDRTAKIKDLIGTIFDIEKYPGPFKLRVPGGKSGDVKYEEMYMPGPSLRSTYPEELMGGRVAPTEVSRYLSNFITAAQTVDSLIKSYSTEKGVVTDIKFSDKFISSIKGELLRALTTQYKRIQEMEGKGIGLSEANLEEINRSINTLKSVLSPTKAVPAVYAVKGIKPKGGFGAQTQLESIESYGVQLEGDTKKYSKLFSRLMDLVIGAQPKSLYKNEQEIKRALKYNEETGAPPQEYAYMGGKFESMMKGRLKRVEERGKAPSVFDVELKADNLEEFTKKLGISLEKSVSDALTNALENLSKSKLQYYEALAGQVLGPKHAIEQVFFQRMAPDAVTGKAISAVTDKVSELNDLLGALKGKQVDIDIDIPNLKELRGDLSELIDEHKKYVKDAKVLGYPVLKEGEIGLSEYMAKKIKVKKGGELSNEVNLAELVQKRVGQEMEDVYVTSLRYPFTGTHSLQAHKARLTESKLAEHAIAVPGAPELDITKLSKILDTLREYVGLVPGERKHYTGETLIEKRETAWQSGQSEKAQQLTKSIEGLIGIIKKATPTFINMEQKLDFDGDALFVHAAQLEESRQEIKKHFDSFGKDITSVRSLFSTLFTEVTETNVKSLAEQSYIFGKKQPSEKGYEWLTKPTIRKNVENLNMNEVLTALFSYSSEFSEMQDIMKGMKKEKKSKAEIESYSEGVFNKWSSKFISSDVLGESFRRTAATSEQQGRYRELLATSKPGAVLSEKFEKGSMERVISDVIEELIRTKLYQQKYNDAIVGQLYKLHTGPTVEGVSRIARMTELETGFGKGLAGTGKFAAEPSEEFLSRWPKESVALGGRPVQEFAARMNEVMRFIIQKGMDEKHAGVRAIGTQILRNIGKRQGVEEIMRVMEVEKNQFDELLDFNEEIANSVKLRLGALSTGEIKKELSLFKSGAVGKKIDMAEITGTRSEMIDEIVKYVDIKSFFEELYRQIKRTAIRGFAKQLETKAAELPIEQAIKVQSEAARMGGFESQAKHVIEEEAGTKGINIRQYITRGLQPLYELRTSAANLGGIASQTGMKVAKPSMALPEDPQTAKRLLRTYENIAKTSKVLGRHMGGAVSERLGDAHSLMVLTAIQKRYEDIVELRERAEQSGIPLSDRGEAIPTEKMAFGVPGLGQSMDVPKLAVNIWNEVVSELARMGPAKKEKNVKEIIVEFSKQKELAAGKVEALSQMAGIPMISKEEESRVYYEKFSKNAEYMENLNLIADQMVSQLVDKGMSQADAEKLSQGYVDALENLVKFQSGMSDQLRRVSESMRGLPFKEKMFKASFPGFEQIIGKDPARMVNRETLRESKKIEDLRKQRLSEELMRERKVHEVLKESMEAGPRSGALKGARKELQELINVADTTSQEVIIDVLKEKRTQLKKLSELATGGINITKGRPSNEVVELYKQYRASGLAGGGGYPTGGYKKTGGSMPQSEAILREMLGLNTRSLFVEATGFRGTALHQKKQKGFVEKYGRENVSLEGFVEDLDNEITGHYDVLYKEFSESGEEKTHLVDIKAIWNERDYEEISKLAEDIKEGKTTLTEVVKKFSKSDNYVRNEIARKLKGYISQVNFYLSKFKDINAIGEIFLTSMTDPNKSDITLTIGKFDKAIFEKDIKAVNESRGAVMAMMSSIGTGQIPEWLEKYRSIYEDFLKSLGTEAPTASQFKKALPKTVTSKALRGVDAENKKLYELGRDRLDIIQEDIFEHLSKEYLQKINSLKGSRYWSSFAEAAGGAGAGAPPPPPPPPTGGGGDDGDDYDKYRKRFEQLKAELSGRGELDPETAKKMLQVLFEVEGKYLSLSKDVSNQLINSYKNLINQLKESLDTFEHGGLSGVKEYARIEDILKNPPRGKITPEDLKVFENLRPSAGGPDDPEALHANLKLLLFRATKRYGLADTGTLKSHGDIFKDLIDQVKIEGPSADISGKIMEELKKLPEGKRSGFKKIWQFYRQAVGEYFIKQLDELRAEIDESASESESRQAFLKYKQTLDKYVKSIRDNVAKGSDIYTEVGMGGVREWVDPELAQRTGLFRTKEELSVLSKHRASMAGEFQPIFDELVKDLHITDIENMESPIEKVRKAFGSLAAPSDDISEVLKDTELFGRLGEEAIKKWDFSTLLKGLTQLRAGLEAFHRMRVSAGSEDYFEAHRKNLEETIRYFKQLEKILTPVGGTAGSPMGLIGVPQFLGSGMQEMLHRRNIAKMIEHYKTPEEQGGPERGEATTYRWKVVDPASKQTLKSFTEEFRKIGDTVDDAGNRIGVFRRKTEDLVKQIQNRRNLGQAFARVTRWGVASTAIYGTITALKNMVSVIADVESGIAVLRQVMSPLETNFEELRDAALGFAKDFGQPIRNVVDSMRVFAQQGLAQSEVIDRTRTSVLAANVSTLSAADATEALTAASKVFSSEAESSVKFLDAWNEVEAKHAITSADLANSLKKAAAAAKTSGFTFDELNAIITAIGATSRQTGKEIGTSLRFIFRRMQSQKGPKALGEVGVPTLTPVGDIRPGFEILGDLASKWDELTNAQRLNIAQAIGGRRHYNSLIILMDHWEEALSTLEDSINSKGAAERRNAIVMETYAKKLQQVRSAMNELQVQFGKFALPLAKKGLEGLKFFIETLTNIPSAVKIAVTAIGSLFFLMEKGSMVLNKFSNMFIGAENVFSDFFASLRNESGKSLYEVFGKTSSVFGKKIDVEQFYPEGIKTKGLTKFTEAESAQELETFLGKVIYMTAKAGRVWNNFLTDLSKGTAIATKKTSTGFDFLGDKMFGLAIASVKKWKQAGLIAGVPLAGLGTTSEMAAMGLDKVAKYLGLTSQQMAKLTESTTGVAGSIGPMLGSFFVLKPLLGDVFNHFKRLTISAQDYERSIDGVRRKTSGELSTIRGLASEYKELERRLEDINKIREPGAKQAAMEREEYVSPLHELGKLYEDSSKYVNKLADANINLVSSFDEFGNAVLRSTGNLKSYLGLMESAKIKEMANVELDVLGKYTEDLTKTGGAETYKYELKTFLEEIPAIGKLLSKSIKIAPAKELEIITKRMNELLSLRSKYPLTTSFDVDISKFKDKLKEARKAYSDTYKDFKRVLAELPTKGLTGEEITKMLGEERFKKGFELVVKFEPKLQTGAIKGKVDWKDVLGTEVLKKIYPEKTLDFVAPLTKGLMEQRNVVKRETEAFGGDVVLFVDKISDKYNMAGNQAILKMKKTTKGMVEWTVEYFDKELMEVREVPYSKVEKFIDSVFPIMAIQDRLADNIEVLKEFVAGAGAGLRGITEQEFKREFSLGERFFSQIPTTTLLQTTKGFEPGKGFGQVGFKSDWDKWIQENFFKPMVEYRQMLERAEKMKLEVGEAEMAPGLAEDIAKLQDVLKNNQVVLQYRAAHEDLMKTLSESSRVLKENIVAERNRVEYITQTGGYLKGFAEDLSDINLGVKKHGDLTAQQRVLFGENNLPGEQKTFTNIRRSIREDMIERESLVKSLSDVDRTLIAVGEISDVARSFGAALPTDELKNYVEKVAITGERGTGLLLNETTKITENTGSTVGRLDDVLGRLDQLLSQGGSEVAFERLLSSPSLFRNSIIIDKLDYLVKERNKQSEKGNVELAAELDRSINGLIGKFLDKTGVEKVWELVKSRGVTTGGFGPVEFLKQTLTSDVSDALLKAGYYKPSTGELTARGFGNIGFKGFTEALERVRPGITEAKEFKDLIKLQKDQDTQQIVSNKNLNKLIAAYSAFEHFNKISSNKQIKQLDDQIYMLESQFEQGVESGKDKSNLSSSLDALKEERAAVVEKMEGQRMRELIAPVAIASEELAKAFGMTEKEIRVLGGTVASTYLAWKIWSQLTGEPIPEYLKEVGEKAKRAAERMSGEGFSTKAWQAYYTGKETIKTGFDKAGDSLKDSLKDLKNSVRAAEDTIKKEETIGKEDLKKAKETIIYGGVKAEDSIVGKIDKDKIKRKIEDELIRKGKDIIVYKTGQKGTVEGGMAKQIAEAIRDKTKEKATSTEEKLYSETQNQTAVLHGIYDNTKQSAEHIFDSAREGHEDRKVDRKKRDDETKAIIDKVDVLRSDYLERQGVGVSPVKQIAGILLAATAAGYVGEKRSDTGRYNELEKRAGKQTELMENILNMHGDVIVEALVDYRKETKKAVERGGPSEFGERSLVVDTIKAEEEVNKRLLEIRKDHISKIKEVNKGLEDAVQKFREAEIVEEIKKQLEDLTSAIKSTEVVEEFKNKFVTEVSGIFTGFRLPQIDAGTRSPLDLTPHEILSMRSDFSKRLHPPGESEQGMDIFEKSIYRIISYIKASIRAARGIEEPTKPEPYIDIARKYGSQYRRRESLVGRAVQITEELTGAEGKTLTVAELKYYEELGKQLGNIKLEILSLNEALSETALTLKRAQIPELVRKSFIETSLDITTQLQNLQLESGMITRPLGFMGRRGIGSGDYGLTMPQREASLSTGQRLITELYESHNYGMFDQIRAYKRAELSSDIYLRKMEESRSAIAKLRAEMGEVANIAGTVSNQYKSLQLDYDAQSQVLMKAENSLRAATNKMREFNDVISGLNLSQLLNDFVNLKESFITGEQSESFRKVTEGVDKIIGGPHPEAPVYPTYAMLQAGVPKEMLGKMTRYDAELAAMRGSGQRTNAADEAEVVFRKHVDILRYNQEQENRRLQSQRELGGRYDEALGRSIRREQEFGTPNRVERLEELREDFRNQMSKIFEIYDRETMEGVGKEGIRYYKGAGESISGLEKGLKSLFGELGISPDPIINSISTQTQAHAGFVNKIIEAINGWGTRAAQTGYQTWLKIIDKIGTKLGIHTNEDNKKNIGGLVSGPGGPMEDVVPILASAGEYVVNTSAAKSIGYGSLDYMNKTGRLPRFQKGGMVDELNRFKKVYGEEKFNEVYGDYANALSNEKRKSGVFKSILGGIETASGGMGKAIGYLSEKRLKSIEEAWMSPYGLEFIPEKTVKGVAAPAALAVGELGTRIAKIPVDVVSMVAGAADWAMSGHVQEDVSDIVTGIKNLSLMDLENTAKAIGTLAVEDVKKGGLGITAGIIDTLLTSRRGFDIGSAVINQLKKLGEIKSVRAATKAIEWLPDDAIKAISSEPDMFSYAKKILKEHPLIAEEIAAEGIGTISKFEMGSVFNRFFDEGGFFGGVFKRSVDPYKMKFQASYLKGSLSKKSKELFEHEFGHGISQYVLDASRFFDKYSIEMPSNLSRMINFIGKEVAVFDKPGIFNFFKSPKRFIKSYVGLEGELASNPKIVKGIGFAFDEKMAELFRLSKKGSGKSIVKKYSKVFSPDKLSEDWSKYVPDEYMDKWNLYMRKGLLGQRAVAKEIPQKIYEKFIGETKGLTNLGYDLAARVDGLKGGQKKLYVKSIGEARQRMLDELAKVDVSKLSPTDYTAMNNLSKLATQQQGLREAEEAIQLVDAIRAGVPKDKLPKVSVSIATAEEIIAGKRTPLPIYEKGVDYVPKNQLAYLHRGEAVIPAEYNSGGKVALPKFAVGGAIDTMRESASNFGEEVAKIIRRELEDVTLSVDKTPLPVEITELTISNTDSLDRLADTLSNINVGNLGSVGADGANSKIDDFIDAANSKFESFTEIIGQHGETITELQLTSTSLKESSADVNRLENKLINLEQSLSESLSKQDYLISSTNNDSKLEAKFSELIKYIEDTHISRLENDTRTYNRKLETVDFTLNNLLDLFDGLSSRVNLQGV